MQLALRTTSAKTPRRSPDTAVSGEVRGTACHRPPVGGPTTHTAERYKPCSPKELEYEKSTYYIISVSIPYPKCSNRTEKLHRSELH